MSALLLLLAPAFAQDILINEVLYDANDSETGGSGDDGWEWIELCNAGSTTVDLSGWTVESAGSSWGAVTVGGNATLTGTLAPGGYLLIGYGSTSNAGAMSPNLQNGGSATDGVRIKNGAGSVVDTVLYDTNNSNGLEDDSGSAGASFAPDVGAGKSIGRFPDCTDTDDSGVDFIEFDATEKSPGNENTTGGGGTGTGGGGSCDNPANGAAIVINEYAANPAGSDGDREWVEVYNASGATVDLSDWSVSFGNAMSSVKDLELLPGTTLAPGEFLVVAGDGAPDHWGFENDDLVWTSTELGEINLSPGNAGSNADALFVIDCEGTVVDTVIYGTSINEDDGWVDDDGVSGLDLESRLAPKPGDNVATARIEDGLDSNDSAADFATAFFPTPGFSNTTEPDCPGRDAIKVNEFIANPEGTDAGLEWIELYNASDETIDLTDWGIGAGTSGTPSLTLFEDVVMAPGDHLLIASGEDVPGADLIADGLSIGNASSNADVVMLMHACGLPADTVFYGPTYLDEEGLPLDEWVDDAGVSGVELDDRLAPSPVESASLARCADGEDTDDSYADFVVDASPTPGAANPDTGCEPPVPPACEPGDGSVKINELFPNPDGTDSGNEFVELVNTGSETVVLDAWRLEWGSSSFSSGFDFPGGTELAPGEFLLIGDSEVPGDVYASLNLGNAGTAPDGLRLVDCRTDEDPVVQDTVLYGDAGAEPEDADLLDDQGEQTMAVMPDDGLTVGRMPDGDDTDDNSVDFVSNLPPTPGAPNSLGGDDGGGDDDNGDDPGTGGCGCGGEKEASTTGKDTDKSCAVVEPRGGLIAMLLALVAVRRRRDGDASRA